MSSLRPTGRFLPFTNNVQRAQKQTVPGSFPQSLSGSETDISTSNENLSNEDRYVIRHTARVEPQGQENLQDGTNRNSLKESLTGGSNRNSLKESVAGPNSNRSSLDVSSSSYNTLIIHNAGQEDNWTGRLSGIRDRSNESQSHATNAPSYHQSIVQQEMIKKSSNIPLPVGGSMKDHPTLPRPTGNYVDIGGHRIYTSPPEQGVQEITEIPDDYLNQSSVLKHLAKEVAQSPTNRSPRETVSSAASPSSSAAHSRTPTRNETDASYDAAKSKSPQAKATQGGNARIKGKLSKEKLSLSRSQPDLSSVGVRPLPGGAEGTSWSSEAGTDLDDDGTCFSEMLDGLAQENAQLKAQLDEAWQKIAKTQKLEEEVRAVHRAHEELVASCERRERLERAARARLQADCRRLQRLAEAPAAPGAPPAPPAAPAAPGHADALRRELHDREALLAQLLAHNKELSCAKERQEIEIAAQRATLQEQRTHIDILDTALTNAQTNVVRLEEECRHGQSYIERVSQLQRALGSLQQASDRREQTERKLRFQLERELQNLRSREGSAGGSGTGGNAGSDMRRHLREKEERILALEGEAAKWEQRYLEEATLRQTAIDAASIPKDAKIAALEKTSQESERLMAEARCEKIRHMDELHDAQKKCADMEGRVKELESKVAERDAMIKVLQKHTQNQAYAAANDSSSSLRNNTSREELVGFAGGTSSNASFSSGDTCQLYGHSHHRHHSHHSHVLHLPPTPSPSALSLQKYGSLSNGSSISKANIATAASNFDSTKRTLDCQLAQLDSRLAGAGAGGAGGPTRGLCCFPAFGATAPRKGKSGKSALAAAAGGAGLFDGGGGGFLGGLVAHAARGRPEEMLLLEKQGLASQRQRLQEAADADDADARRCGSLPPPPSSLPRPPRRPSARRLGEYGRLDASPDGRKGSAGEASLAGGGASRGSPARSLLPAPRRLGEYGRLGDEPRQRSLPLRGAVARAGPSGSGSRESLVKAADARSDSSLGGSSAKGASARGDSSRESLAKRIRDSGASTTASENSATSLPSPSRLAAYAAARTKRGNSLSRDGKSIDGSVDKYRIQF